MFGRVVVGVGVVVVVAVLVSCGGGEVKREVVERSSIPERVADELESIDLERELPPGLEDFAD